MEQKALKLIMAGLLILSMALTGREAAEYVGAMHAVNALRETGMGADDSGRLCVVVDAGHGGDDPGKIGINGAPEKDINLQIAQKLKKYLDDLCLPYPEGAKNSCLEGKWFDKTLSFEENDRKIQIIEINRKTENELLINFHLKDRLVSVEAGFENWIGLHGNNNRIDHCYFANKRARGLVIQITVEDGGDHNHHQIDHNIFGYRKPFGGNGAEIIRVGNSWSSQLPSYSIIEENIFYHCDGENEIISVKSGFNTVRRNLFYESRGGLVCRHGHNNIIDSNVIIGNQLPGTSGIRIINQGHTVSNNYVEGVTGKGSSAAFILRMGVYERPSAPEDYEDEKLKSYHRAANIDIAFNTFVDCAELNFGDGQGDKEPQNVRFAHNRIYSPNTFPNIKINNPAIFPGTTFVDNLCQFKSKESPAIKGFQSITFNKEQIKAQRRQAVSPADCGTTWHSAELNEIDILTGLMQQ